LLAKTFAKYDNLIGYELLNEPWAGDIFTRPTLLEPTVADKVNLAPLYDKVNKAIRQVDPLHLILFEPVTWDDTKVGFEEVPGGAAFKNRSVLAYHIYVPPDLSIDQAFLVRQVDINNLGCGGFLTEFYIDQEYVAIIPHVGSQADLYKQSWAGWEYKPYVPKTGFSNSFFFENGSLDYDVIKAVSRSYPMAVSGKTLSIIYIDRTAHFNLEYETNTAIKQPTEIYLNEKLNYPKGYTVDLFPGGVATWNTTTNRVFVWTKPGNNKIPLSVTIQRK